MIELQISQRWQSWQTGKSMEALPVLNYNIIAKLPILPLMWNSHYIYTGSPRVYNNTLCIQYRTLPEFYN